ncbi:MAG: serine/threonine protein kinase [Kofleriaceae bacterium]|nr:serine/threonine protein kinase [Kofleriaceae bacterium]
MQVASPCPRDGATPLSQDGDAMLGATLGSYRIASKLGSGGMGSVYRAVQPMIGSVVAIKVLSHESANDSDVVNRFFDEARSVNVIRHHNIVNILDLARLPDGRPYIVMEFLDGVSLKFAISRGPMAVTEAYRIVSAVLDALAAAHERGVLHRDLKPDNIVLSPNGRVTLVDFGVAKIGASLSSTPRTESGVILGTPHYMSPEQAQGRQVDATADIYAMGILLYEMVTGHKPFDGASLFEILRQQIQDQPRPPSQLVALPAGVENIILIALAKDARERFGSARAMQNALRQVVTSDSSTVIRPASNEVTHNLRSSDSARRDREAHASSHSMVASANVVAPRRSRLPWLVAAAAIIGSAVAITVLSKQRSKPAAASGRAGSAAMVAAALPLAAVSGGVQLEPNTAMVASQRRAVPPEPMGPPKVGDVRSIEEYIVAAQSGDPTRAQAASRSIAQQPDPTSPFELGADGKFDIDGFADFAFKRARQVAPDAQLLTLEFAHVSRTGRATAEPASISSISATFVSRALAARPPDVAASEPWSPLARIQIVVGSDGIALQRSMPVAEQVMPLPTCKPSQIWQRALQRSAPFIIDDASISYNGHRNGWFFELNDSKLRIEFSLDDNCR